AHEAAKPMNPASAMKLVTTFAALELLGPDYRWTTQAFLDGPLDHGVLHGNLVLKGHGDPKITIEQWQGFMAKLVTPGLTEGDGGGMDRSVGAAGAPRPAGCGGTPPGAKQGRAGGPPSNSKREKVGVRPSRGGGGRGGGGPPPAQNHGARPPPAALFRRLRRL